MTEAAFGAAAITRDEFAGEGELPARSVGSATVRWGRGDGTGEERLTSSLAQLGQASGTLEPCKSPW